MITACKSDPHNQLHEKIKPIITNYLLKHSDNEKLIIDSVKILDVDTMSTKSDSAGNLDYLTTSIAKMQKQGLHQTDEYVAKFKRFDNLREILKSNKLDSTDMKGYLVKFTMIGHTDDGVQRNLDSVQLT
jgi:hypothetical protein